MRGIGAYVVAGLLVLASLPIYWMVYQRYSGASDAPGVAATVRGTTPLPSRTPRRLVMSRDEDEALNALIGHRAKCVAGVVYRTSDHVIEPWPGRVKCVSDLDNTWSGVVPSGAN